jgi:RimJ/RimL family protein N-acetyltransferase
MLSEEFWAIGYASEIAALLIDFGFETLGLNKIIATCDVRNLPSEKVMQKCGMKKEALLRDHRNVDGIPSDELRYAIYAQEPHNKPLKATPRNGAP